MKKEKPKDMTDIMEELQKNVPATGKTTFNMTKIQDAANEARSIKEVEQAVNGNSQKK